MSVKSFITLDPRYDCCQTGPAELLSRSNFCLPSTKVKLMSGYTLNESNKWPLTVKSLCLCQSHSLLLALTNKPSFYVTQLITCVKSFMIQAPGGIFTTLHFLHNLRTGPISQSIFHWQAFTAQCYVTVWLNGLISDLRRKLSVVNMVPGHYLTSGQNFPTFLE